MYIKITLHVTDDFHFLQEQKKPKNKNTKHFLLKGQIWFIIRKLLFFSFFDNET